MRNFVSAMSSKLHTTHENLVWNECLALFFLPLVHFFFAQFDHVNAGMINATADGAYTNDPFGKQVGYI